LRSWLPPAPLPEEECVPILRSLLTKARAAALRRTRLWSRPVTRPSILMYHRIAEDSFDPWGLAVSPSRFADHLRWLRESRVVFPLAEFVARHEARELPQNAVALTFDDGYACSAEVAAPLLEDARLPATIFIPAELIERGNPFWWDELRMLVFTHAGKQLTLDGKQVDLGLCHPDDDRWAPGARPRTPRQNAFRRIWAALREKPPLKLDAAMEGIRSQAPEATTRDGPRPMSPQQVRNTSSSLIQFGSHALTHPWLTSLNNTEKRAEIGESIERVGKLAGRRPTAFAYPYGDFDADSERLAEEAGFLCACATMGRPIAPDSRMFAMPRIAVGNWSPKEIRAHLRG